MRRLIDPRRWSLETRIVAVALVPALVITFVVIDSTRERWLAIVVFLAVRSLVVAPWANRRSRPKAAVADVGNP